MILALLSLAAAGDLEWWVEEDGSVHVREVDACTANPAACALSKETLDAMMVRIREREERCRAAKAAGDVPLECVPPNERPATRTVYGPGDIAADFARFDAVRAPVASATSTRASSLARECYLRLGWTEKGRDIASDAAYLDSLLLTGKTEHEILDVLGATDDAARRQPSLREVLAL